MLRRRHAAVSPSLQEAAYCLLITGARRPLAWLRSASSLEAVITGRLVGVERGVRASVQAPLRWEGRRRRRQRAAVKGATRSARRLTAMLV